MNRWIKRAKDKGRDKTKDLGILVVILLVLFILNGCQMDEKDAAVVLRLLLF